MSQQISYSQLANRLSTSLKLSGMCTGSGFVFSDSAPAGMKAHKGRVPAGCRFWQDAASSAFVTSSADHNLCAIGIHTHNLQSSPAQQTELMDALKVFADLSYVRPQDVAAIPVLKSQPAVVIYSPLTSCTAISRSGGAFCRCQPDPASCFPKRRSRSRAGTRPPWVDPPAR